MPNKASAKKRLRQTVKKTTENKNRKTRIKTFVKKVEQAIVLNTEFLPNYVKNLNNSENISKVIIGNGTTSRQIIEKLEFFSVIFRTLKRAFQASGL